MSIKSTVILAAAACFSAGFAAPATAQYPEAGKTIHLLVGYGTGGGTDLAARLLATGLEERLGTQVVVENYAAGGGLEAINRLVASEPDGYTVALVPLPAAAMLYLDPERGGTFTREDVTVIATHDYSVLSIATAADGPWTSLGQVIAAAKEKPNAISSSSSGVLSNGHLGVLLLNQRAGVQINWTTFENAGLIRTAVLGHHVDLEFSGMGEVAPAVHSGDLRLLAVLSDQRLPGFDDVPTAVEQGIDLVSQSTRVVIAPKGTPAEVVSNLETAIESLTKDAAYAAKAEALSVSLLYQDSATTQTFWQTIDDTFGPLVGQFRGQ